MANYDTIPGAAYVVTAKTDTTITDANGLELEVPGGEQRTFFATTESVSIEGSCTITQARGNFSLPIGLGIGGPYLPKPEGIPDGKPLENGHVYLCQSTAAAPLDLRSVEIKDYATCEIWVDYTAGEVRWPEVWSWVDNIEPSNWQAGHRYCVAVRFDGYSVLAHMAYSYSPVTSN